MYNINCLSSNFCHVLTYVCEKMVLLWWSCLFSVLSAVWILQNHTTLRWGRILFLCGTFFSFLWQSFFSCGTVFFLWHSFNFGCFICLISAISVQNQNMVWRKNILTGYTNLRESCNLIYVLWKNIHLHIWSDLCICRCSGSKNCVGNNIKWREKEKSAKPMFCGKSKFVVFPLGGRSVRECRRWVCAIC